MGQDKVPPRQLILEAVVTCIEKYGMEGLTTRKIAQEAGTNLASINYYFRTKEDLVAEALTMTIHHMMEDVFATLERSDLSFAEQLREVFFYLIEGGFHFPGISAAHLYRIVVEKRYDSSSAQVMRQVLDRLVARATEAYPQQDPAELTLVLTQIFSSILFLMFTPDFLPLDERFRPTSSEQCRALAERYTRLFLTTVEAL